MIKIIDLQKKYYENPNNQKIKEEYFKLCFDFFINTQTSIDNLNEIAENEGISAQIITECADAYYKEFITKKNPCDQYQLKLSSYKFLTSKTIIKKFINNDSFIVKEFCQKEKITLEQFNKYLEVIKLFDNSLYSKYLMKISEDNTEYIKYITNKIKELVHHIKNGTEISNDIFREYDAIDFFQNNYLDFQLIKKYGTSNNIGRENSLTLNKFLKNKLGLATRGNTTYIITPTIEKILNQNNTICCIIDEYGNLIENTGITLNEEQKLYIIKHLNDNNIPVNHLIFSAAAKRFVGGISLFKKNPITGDKENITILELSKILRGRKVNEEKNYYLRSAYNKKCYDIFIYNDGKRNLLDKAAEETGINVYSIKNHAIQYATTILKMTEEDFLNKYNQFYIEIKSSKKNKMIPTLYNQLILNLIDTNNEEQIINIMTTFEEEYIKQNEKTVDFKYLKSRVRDTINSFFDGDDFLVEEIRNKMNIYINMKKNEKIQTIKELEIKKLQDIKTFVCSFIASTDLTLEEYCAENNISKKEILEHIKTLASFDKDIYNKFIDKINNEKLQNNKNITILQERLTDSFEKSMYSSLESLVYYLQNGVNSNNEIRKFDIIDYYSLIGIKKEQITRLCRKFGFSIEQIKLVGKLFTKYDSYDKTAEKLAFLKEENIYERNGKIFTIEERREIFKYLEELGTPLNQGIFNVAMKRYQAGTLFEVPNNNIAKSKIKTLQQQKN